MHPILSTYVQVEGFMAEVTKHLTLEGGGEKHRFPRLAQDIEFIAVSLAKLGINREPLDFQTMESIG